MTLSIINQVIRTTEEDGRHTAGMSLYLFGSVASGANIHKDVDVLLVYPSGHLNHAHDLAEALRQLEVYPPIEVLALSQDEEEEADFVRTQRAVQLWPS